ncbi:hypothetical protein [Mesorhizobium sp. M7A.F.Ca.US.010.02.1.1]|uniref:hypothetical protein n=1 Tax=Mesorhizobium sp. M7A.F.Ca.US.010.02.1.1 TaxID=2496743 RepID=UPI000FD3DD50|nr:hypothetical protein [Mesorhizobium sp. M7A.F.Ca.US.010.02.1.1]RUW92058.1 hypothetical protein EOA19_11805 [Mesorhizobium sp. M7A.F.Ca.US.010.02.1.1]
MRDSDLTERPGKGWTPWKEGPVDLEIDRVWWAARVLHFAKLNVSCWFDGSDLVAIEHWGFRRPKWTMKNKPRDWQPLPEVYRIAREEEQAAALERFRASQAVNRARVLKLSEGRPTPAQP